MLSPLENDALKGIIPQLPTFPWEVRGVSSFEFFQNLDFFPTIFRGGFADSPVLAPPVFESTGGPAIFVEPPIPPPTPTLPTQVSIFSDIVSVLTGPSDVGTGGGGIFGDVLGNIVLRQTTSAEERVLGGIGLPGDIAKAIGNIQGDIRATTGLIHALQPGGFNLANGILDTLTGGSIGVAPCPSPGGSQGFPAGSCITINDWQQLGAPKGFEVAGVSAGGTLILRKKRRRRRRGGLTKGMMTDVDYLARKLGKPAAETYLNRVL